jgi:hypothetical protein
MARVSSAAGAVLVIVGVGSLFAPPVAARLGLPPGGLGVAYLVAGACLIAARIAGKGERLAAQVVGIVFTVIGLLGLTSAGAIFAAVAVTPVSNAFHLIVGIVGQYAGFGGGASRHP